MRANGRKLKNMNAKSIIIRSKIPRSDAVFGRFGGLAPLRGIDSRYIDNLDSRLLRELDRSGRVRHYTIYIKSR